MLTRWTTGPAARRQRGMSLVELMVGIAIGLVIVAAASFVMTSQLVENRRLLSETQVQQDLRAAADVMARDIRRAGTISDDDALASIWYPGAAGTQYNSRAAAFAISGGGSRIDYEYWAGATAASPTFAYTLTGIAIKTQMSGIMQDLTDPNAMRVTALTMGVATDSSGDAALPCPKICTSPIGIGPTDCWPRVKVRRATLAIESEARGDSSVKRALSGAMRLRNDYVTFAEPLAQLACPS